MIISKRKYYGNYFIAMSVVGVLIFLSAPIANKYLFHIKLINDICKYAILAEVIIIIAVIVINILKNKGIKNYISNRQLLSYIENNLIFRIDVVGLNRMSDELQAIGRNINQIAYKVNKFGSLRIDQLRELQDDMEKIKSVFSDIFVSELRLYEYDQL